MKRVVLSVSLAISLAALFGCDQPPGDIAVMTEADVQPTVSLSHLPPNQWVKYHELADGSWWRQGHASMVFDANRGNLLVFGSDTHNQDWDNVVHEFDIEKREWTHHDLADPAETYLLHPNGHLVAGVDGDKPWAMHTYDGVVFDAAHDKLVVTSTPGHNPRRKSLPKASLSPVWLYDMKSRSWSTFIDDNHTFNAGFGAAAYDSLGKKTFICSKGLWILDLRVGSLMKVAKAPNCLHVTMAVDSRRRGLYLFGAYKDKTRVRRLSSGLIPDDESTWEELVATGDPVPQFTHATVAYDKLAGVFLISAAERRRDAASDAARTTFLYDPSLNAFKVLPEAEVAHPGLNFMLVRDEKRNLYFHASGSANDGITIWVLRLDRRLLN